MKLTKRPSWALGALAAGASIVTAIGLATPARAALSGTDWIQQDLPANFFVVGAAPLSPVSCVPGTQFCMVLASDTSVVVNGDLAGNSALVTTDAGRTWNDYATLPSTFLVGAVSCVSASVCWAAGTNAQDGPGVAETTDGGQTWTDKSPAAWATATWWPNAMDCVSATTC